MKTVCSLLRRAPDESGRYCPANPGPSRLAVLASTGCEDLATEFGTIFGSPAVGRYQLNVEFRTAQQKTQCPGIVDIAADIGVEYDG